LIETKKMELLQICKHECNNPLRPPSPNLIEFIEMNVNLKERLEEFEGEFEKEKFVDM